MFFLGGGKSPSVCPSPKDLAPPPTPTGLHHAAIVVTVSHKRRARLALVRSHRLQVSNRGHRGVLLSVLCDLLENPRSHPFFHAWKSARDGRTSAQLLLSVWRDEEAARGMTASGVLANTKEPLAGTGARAAWAPQEGVVFSGLASLPAPEELPASITQRGSTITLGKSLSGTAALGAAPGERLKLDPPTVVAALLEASAGERVLAKVYGCFRLLGFGAFTSLAPADAATLALVDM